MTRYAEVAEITERCMRVQREARGEAVRSCRAIEKALQEALAGGCIHGLANLGAKNRPFYGARLRTHPDMRLEGNQTSICLDSGGRLVLATKTPDTIEIEPAADDQLWAEDGECLPKTLEIVLARHLERATINAARYEKLLQIAKCTNEVLS